MPLAGRTSALTIWSTSRSSNWRRHDIATAGATSERLFAARCSQSWPPTVVAYDGWDTIYSEAAAGLGVIDNVAEAVAWANDFIVRTAH